MNNKDHQLLFHVKQQQEPRQLNKQRKFQSVNLFAVELGTIWNANKSVYTSSKLPQ